MVVTQERTVELRPWNTFANPAFPEGSWFASFSIAHAGGGGLVTARAQFQVAGENLSSRLWNLEHLTVDTLGALGGIIIEATTVNLETFQRVGAVAQVVAFQMSDLPISGRAIKGDEFDVLPWFLGAPRIAGLVAALDIRSIDGGVGERTNAFMAGYFWGPAARNAPGGPQRPTTGLFGP